MKAVVIGGSGHIGTFLIPRLIESGYEVTNVTRGTRAPYVPHAAWDQVEQIQIDREAEDAAGTFGKKIQALNADVVIDMICFTPESAAKIVEPLKGTVRQWPGVQQQVCACFQEIPVLSWNTSRSYRFKCLILSEMYSALIVIAPTQATPKLPIRERQDPPDRLSASSSLSSGG